MNKTILILIAVIAALSVTITVILLKKPSNSKISSEIEKQITSVNEQINQEKRNFLTIDEKELTRRLEDKSNYSQLTIFVSQSQAVWPMNIAKIFEVNGSDRQLICDNAVVTYIQFRANSPFQKPQFPCDAFITLLVTKDTVGKITSDKNYSITPINRNQQNDSNNQNTPTE